MDGAGLAERCEFPDDRLQRCGGLHARQRRGRHHRARPARLIRRCRVRCASRWARAPRTMRCSRASRRHDRRRTGACSWTATARSTRSRPTNRWTVSTRSACMPGVIPALLELKRAGFSFVMVTNQDGLGTPSLPLARFEAAHRFHPRFVRLAGRASSTPCSSARTSSTRAAPAASRKPRWWSDYVARAPARPGAQLHGRRPRHRP